MGKTHVTTTPRSVVVFQLPIADDDFEPEPLETVGSVNIDRILGRWYEIARYPAWPHKDNMAITIDYSLRANGLIEVVKSFRKGSLDGKLKQATGRAKVVDQVTNARLKVSFFRPFWSDLWIIDLDPDYQWAVIGEPSRKKLWILGRKPKMDDDVFEGIVSRLSTKGYDPDLFMKTPQPIASELG